MHVNSQDFNTYTIRASAVLTTGYVAGVVLGPNELCEQQNTLVIMPSFTLGSLTDGRIRVRFSPDNTTFYQETYQSSVTAGVALEVPKEHQFTATGNYRLVIPIKDRYIEISALGTGTVTNSLMAITAAVGSV